MNHEEYQGRLAEAEDADERLLVACELAGAGDVARALPLFRRNLADAADPVLLLDAADALAERCDAGALAWEALGLAQREAEHQGDAQSLAAVGAAWRRHGDEVRGVALIRGALDLADRVGCLLAILNQHRDLFDDLAQAGALRRAEALSADPIDDLEVALAQVARGAVGEANRLLDRAWRRASDPIDLLAVADFECERGRPECAARALESAEALASDAGDWFILAEAWGDLGHPERARACARAAETLVADPSEMVAVARCVGRALGDPRWALRLLESLHGSDDAEALLEGIDLLGQLGARGRALALVEELGELDGCASAKAFAVYLLADRTRLDDPETAALLLEAARAAAQTDDEQFEVDAAAAELDSMSSARAG